MELTDFTEPSPRLGTRAVQRSEEAGQGKLPASALL